MVDTFGGAGLEEPDESDDGDESAGKDEASFSHAAPSRELRANIFLTPDVPFFLRRDVVFAVY